MRRRGFEAADITRIAVFAALLAVLGLPGPIPLFGGAVPITAQTLGVMLAGAVLGPWRGAASVAVLEVLVAVGLPLLSGGRGGLGVFFGPTAGYLVGWIAGVIVIGLIARAGGGRPRWWRTAIACIVGGVGVIYLVGIPVQSLVTGLGLGETIISSLVFLPGDFVKVAVTVLVVQALWRAYPRAFGGGGGASSRGAREARA
ncbi:MAG: biotin transporter BioY [Pseudoclavibacter sp.]